MRSTVLYISQKQISTPDTWDRIRRWQRESGTSWDKVRVTPDFYLAPGIQRDEMQGMLDMVRAGSVDRVLYAELAEEQTLDLDWLAFAFSLQKHHITLETLGEGTLDLAKKLQQLTTGFQAMHMSSSC